MPSPKEQWSSILKINEKIEDIGRILYGGVPAHALPRFRKALVRALAVLRSEAYHFTKKHGTP